jgi:hypothetical protein
VKKYPARKALTLGELVASVYSACGGQLAPGVLRLATEAHLVEARGHRHLVISQLRRD